MRSLVGPTVLAMVLAMALGVAGCGDKNGSDGARSPSPSPASPTDTAVPAVANPTDLGSKPQVSRGNGPKPTQLVVKDLVVGTGPEATASSTVQVHYVGVNFDDGREFDSSWARGQPADFPLNRVIPGFSRGIVGMKVGGRRQLVIPPDLGYGARGSPPAVGPYQTLVFVIDLVAVK